MTTCVKVTACYDDAVEVHVYITEKGVITEQQTLQHSETKEYYVYDDRTICVKEVSK